MKQLPILALALVAVVIGVIGATTSALHPFVAVLIVVLVASWAFAKIIG